MNREIKFRMLVTYCMSEKPHWIYKRGDLSLWGMYNEQGNWHTYSDTLDANETLCQFTGLHDSKGKEIYEGDILLDIAWSYEGKQFLSVVKWDEKSSAFEAEEWCRTNGKLERLNNNFLYTFRIPENFEVIGNIYENKELIEK